MTLVPAWRVILATFFALGWKAKRLRLFVLFCLVPVLVLLVIKVFERQAGITAREFFSSSLLVFYFQLLIPVLGLFYGSSVVNDEIDNRTLVYLTTCPVPKAAILLGKFLAFFLITAILIGGGFFVSFLIAHLRDLARAEPWLELLGYLGVSALALLSYSALFTLLGSFMKKSLLFGLFFIFGWENVVQYFPGSTQKFTLIHYIKSLLPILPQENKFLMFHLEPSSPLESVLMLAGLALVFLVAAVIVFEKKEYILSESN